MPEPLPKKTARWKFFQKIPTSKKIILLGVLSGILFSSTFVINHYLFDNSSDTGHWFWTASLRYIYVFFLLSLLITAIYGVKIFKQTIQCFFKYWRFWIIAGGIGFGLFYLAICFATYHGEMKGWIVATPWQLTILATPLVLMLLGKHVDWRVIACLLVMFTGTFLVYSSEFEAIDLDWDIVLKISAIVFAAFCYPLGNTLCKYACEPKDSDQKIPKFLSPAISAEAAYSVMAKNVSSQILMMTMGSAPLFLIVGLCLENTGIPSSNQLISVAFVAVISGVIATGLLYEARQMADKDNALLVAADSTQAVEAPTVLLLEWWIGTSLIIKPLSFVGLGLVVIGIAIFAYFKKR